MADARRILDDMFSAYKHSSQYKDAAMMEIMSRREEFEKHLDKMWGIFRSGLFEQAVEYKKQVRSIKATERSVAVEKTEESASPKVLSGTANWR